MYVYSKEMRKQRKSYGSSYSFSKWAEQPKKQPNWPAILSPWPFHRPTLSPDAPSSHALFLGVRSTPARREQPSSSS